MSKLWVLLIVLGFSSASGAAVEEECTGAASSSKACLYFFKGYLFGLSESAERDVTVERNGDSSQESFTERAIRTRLGIGDDNRSTGTPVYCIPESVELVSVAAGLQQEFDNNPEKWAEAQDPILDALRQSYPCESL